MKFEQQLLEKLSRINDDDDDEWWKIESGFKEVLPWKGQVGYQRHQLHVK